MYFCLWTVLLNTVVPTGTYDRDKAPLCEPVRGKNVGLLFWLAIQKVSNAGHCCSTFKVVRKAEMESKDVMTSMLTHLFPECWHAIQKFHTGGGGIMLAFCGLVKKSRADVITLPYSNIAGCLCKRMHTNDIHTNILAVALLYILYVAFKCQVDAKFGLSLKIDLYNGCYGRHAHRQ